MNLFKLLLALMLSVQVVHFHAADNNARLPLHNRNNQFSDETLVLDRELSLLLTNHTDLNISLQKYKALLQGWQLTRSQQDLPGFINELCQSDQLEESHTDDTDVEEGNNFSSSIIKAVEKTIMHKFVDNGDHQSQFCTTLCNVVDDKIDLNQIPNPQRVWGQYNPVLSWLYNHKHDPVFEYCTQTPCMKPVIQHYIKNGFVSGADGVIKDILQENNSHGMQFLMNHYYLSQDVLDNLLARAVRQDADNIIPLLIAKGANTQQQYTAGFTLLHSATACKAIKSIPLLATQININQSNQFGQTPLHFAATCRFMAMETVIPLLLAHGSDVHKKDASGKTALHLAAYNIGDNIIPLLLAAGAQVNDRDNNNQTPLHAVCTTNSSFIGNISSVMSQLIDAGADLGALDNNNKKPDNYSNLLTAVLLFKNRS